jgi:hypothetical protein
VRRILRGARAVVVVAALAWGLLLAGLTVIAYRGDPRGFFVAGSLHPHPPELAGAPTRQGPGYDGQFFAALAVDPLLLRPETPGYLDLPPYRAGRVGLPLAAWLLAVGHRPAAILVYLALCGLLGLLGVWVAARWLEDLGHSPWGALPLALSVGLVTTTTRALPDAAAASLLLLALWRESRGRSGAAGLLAAASLVRETSLIAAGGLALVRWREGSRRGAVRAVAVPAAVAFGWRAWVASRLAVAGTGPPDLGRPLVWVAAKLAVPWTLDSIAETVALAALLLAAAALAPLLPRWRSWSPAAWTYAGIVTLLFLVGGPIYADRWGYGRASCALPMLAVPLAATEDRPGVARLLRAVPLAYAVAGALTILLMTRLPAMLGAP